MSLVQSLPQGALDIAGDIHGTPLTNAVATKELSSSEIKNFINTQIEYEDKAEPLTDDELLERIEKRFNIKMVRRTITKYRKLMNVASSKERKKIYKVQA